MTRHWRLYRKGGEDQAALGLSQQGLLVSLPIIMTKHLSKHIRGGTLFYSQSQRFWPTVSLLGTSVMDKCESSMSWNKADHFLIARRTETEKGRDKQHFPYLSCHSEGTNKMQPLNGSCIEDCPYCQQY